MTLSDDVAAAVEHLMRSEHIGRSEALNRIARAGLTGHRPPSSRGATANVPTFDLGVRVDVTNVAEAIELIEQWDREHLGEGPTGRAG